MHNNSASQPSIELPILPPNPSKPKRSQAKSGRGKVRACVLIAVHLVILAHIAHFWLVGRTLSPVEPSESMYTLDRGYVNAGAILFVLAIVSTAIFGRFFCGWGCHLVALQDLSGYLLGRLGFRPKPLRSRLLAWVPFGLAFYMFLWPTLNRLWHGTSHPGFTNHLITEQFWVTFPGPAVSILTFAVCGGLAVYLFGNKGFCTYACPYGAFFSISDRLAIGRIRVTDACQHCGQCTAHCTSNVKVHAEVRDFGMVVDPGCMKCMDCVSVCPNGALYYGLTSRPGMENSSRSLPDSKKPLQSTKDYDFSFPEDLMGLAVAGVCVFAIRGLYDIVPLLLSVAVAAMTAYLAVYFWRVFRKRDLRLQNIQLKRNGHITRIGRVALVGLCGWFVLVGHSFFVQYHRYQGRSQLSRIPATWTELVVGSAQQRLTQEDRSNSQKAFHSYQLSDRIGLVDVFEIKLGLAICNLIEGDVKSAEVYLRQAYDCDAPAAREMLQEFLVTQGRQDEAAAIE